MKMKLPFTISIVVFSLIIVAAVQAQNGLPTPDQQIKAAISAAPEKMQKEASVLGYAEDGSLISLREGTGELICLADDPEDSRFHVACYFRELEPFMKRGRELRAEGKSRKEVREVRRSEIESGKLDYPDKPMALYSLTGPAEGFDYSKGIIRKAKALQVVYVPFATVESTGITGNPTAPGGPWLMDPGTPWAHIMIPGDSVGMEEKEEN